MEQTRAHPKNTLTMKKCPFINVNKTQWLTTDGCLLVVTPACFRPSGRQTSNGWGNSDMMA